MNSFQDTEITISHGDQRAVASTHGAALRRYFLRAADQSEREIAWGYSGAVNKQGGQGDVLIPFPGRVRQGRYTFGGTTYQMERNDKEGPNAIHGFLRGVDWLAERTGDAAVRFRTQIPGNNSPPAGYPFRLGVEVEYSLADSGLVVAFQVRNNGDSAAPVGVGFHPYFVAGTPSVDEIEAQIPATGFLPMDETLCPTGQVLPVEGMDVDFRRWRRVAGTRLNTCYAGLLPDGDGITRVRLRDPSADRRVTVWMDGAFKYIVAYTGDAIPPPGNRRALAIEPMTCSSDAFNHLDWGLVSLEPDATLEGRWGVTPDS